MERCWLLRLTAIQGLVGLVSPSTVPAFPRARSFIPAERKKEEVNQIESEELKASLYISTTFGPEKNFSMPEDGEYYGKHGKLPFLL